MNTRRSFLEGAGGRSFALLCSLVFPAYGAQVVDVRAWPAEEYTRITIEHDAPDEVQILCSAQFRSGQIGCGY